MADLAVLDLQWAGYWAAMLLALLAVRWGSWTALALVASGIAVEALAGQGVGFYLPLWVAIDCAAILVVLCLQRPLGRIDAAVLMLLVPAWVFYLLPSLRFDGLLCVVTIQLGLATASAWRTQAYRS